MLKTHTLYSKTILTLKIHIFKDEILRTNMYQYLENRVKV